MTAERTITFDVIGEAQAKGSARGFVVPAKGREDRKGPQRYRAVITSANPNLKRWESTIAAEANIAARRTGVFFHEAVKIKLEFKLIRPQSVSVKSRPYPTVTPDLDKLVRGAVDPLKGVLFRDDAQIISIAATKRYVDDGPARLVITIGPIIEPYVTPAGAFDEGRSLLP